MQFNPTFQGYNERKVEMARPRSADEGWQIAKDWGKFTLFSLLHWRSALIERVYMIGVSPLNYDYFQNWININDAQFFLIISNFEWRKTANLASKILEANT